MSETATELRPTTFATPDAELRTDELSARARM
jgi:hypothetical protein